MTHGSSNFVGEVWGGVHTLAVYAAALCCKDGWDLHMTGPLPTRWWRV